MLLFYTDKGLHKHSPEQVSTFHRLIVRVIPLCNPKGCVADFYAAGKMSDATIHSDLDIADIESIPIKPLNHREVDVEIVKADMEGSYHRSPLCRNSQLTFSGLVGYVRSYIILPGTIYGLPSGKIADIGLQNRHSKQVPYFIRNALEKGYVSVADKGENVWPCVHISDRKCETFMQPYGERLTLIIQVADLYTVLYDAATNSPAGTAHGREGYYYGVNGEYKHADVLEVIANVLFEIGKVKERDLKPFSAEDYEKDPMVRKLFL